MRGNRRLQRNGYQRVRKNGPYDEFPLEVREFLEICEGIARRMLTEGEGPARCERSENCFPPNDGERRDTGKIVPNNATKRGRAAL